MPKYIEDSQLLAAVYNNHVDVNKRKSGLKELAKFPYLDWANDKSSFELYVDSSAYSNSNLVYVGSNPNITQYNLPLIYYCGIDACSTKHIWDKFNTEQAHPTEWIMPTSEPRYNTEQFNQRYYYDFILKPAIPFIIDMMNTGQEMDMSVVDTLKTEVKTFNKQIIETINESWIVKEFHEMIDSERIEKFLTPVRKAMKQPKYTGYKSNPKMRAFVVNYLIGTNYETLSDKELKLLDNPLLQPLITKQYNHSDIVTASNAYAESEAYRQNVKANRIDKIEHPEKYVKLGFNPYNYSQLTKMWMYFGLESDTISKDTGLPSYSKDVLEKLVKETEGEIHNIIKLYLEVAKSKNMITQYIPKYYGSTYENRLYYAIRLMGTFTGRLSGKTGAAGIVEPEKHMMGANAVTQPVGHKVYGKTVKSMFIAPKGRIIAAVDYNGLENHINAILTHDETTIKILSKDQITGLSWDMHTLHSTMFFKEEWEELTQVPYNSSIEYNNMCYNLTNEDTEQGKKAKSLRTKSKSCTFKLAYLGGVDENKGGAITQIVYDRYHYELYPGVDAFTNDYVAPTIQEQGYLHLNWGLKLATNNPSGDLLSMNNANFQSYSDLTLIAGTKFRQLYLSKGNPYNIQPVNIIHDALYFELNDTIEAIQWLNNNLISIMTQDFIKDQVVHLRAEVDFGYKQSHMVTLPNDASIEEIQNKLKEL